MTPASPPISGQARRWPARRALLLGFAITLLAIEPAPLVPIARAYAALCEQFPMLAIAANHLPPLPLALLISMGAAALLAGVWAGATGLLATRRFIHQIEQAGVATPDRVAGIAGELGLAARVTYVPWPRPMACCYGFLRPRIAVTAGLLERVDDEELRAVLGHERAHLWRRDPLRYLLLDALTAAAFLVPVAPFLCARWRVRSEFAADRAATAITSRGALAGALLALLRPPPLPPGIVGLTATEARIAQLAGKPAVPPIPRRAVAASLGLGVVFVQAMRILSSQTDLVRMVCPFCPWLM